METSKTKKADSTKKSNASAQNQLEKKSKKEGKTSIEYPAWTMPGYLNEKDHKDLKRVYELYSEGKNELALSFASDLEIVLIKEIPSDIWEKIGGNPLASTDNIKALVSEAKEENENEAVEQEENHNVEEITSAGEEPFTGQENELKEEETSDVYNNHEKVVSEPKQGIVIKQSFQFKHGFVLKNGRLFPFTNLTIENNSQIDEANFYANSDVEEFIFL